MVLLVTCSGTGYASLDIIVTASANRTVKVSGWRRTVVMVMVMVTQAMSDDSERYRDCVTVTES